MSAVRSSPPEPTLPLRTDDPTAAAGRRTLFDVALGAIAGFLAWILSIVVFVIVSVALVDRPTFDGTLADVMWLASMAIAVLAGIGFVKRRIATRVRLVACRRRVAVTRGECPRCAYSLRGLPEPRCPECGERFTESEFADLKKTHPAESESSTYYSGTE